MMFEFGPPVLPMYKNLMISFKQKIFSGVLFLMVMKPVDWHILTECYWIALFFPFDEYWNW